MDEFARAVMDVEQKCSELLESPRYQWDSLPKDTPAAGIYLFSENGQALYVGRTNNLKRRLRGHTANSHYTATFAFLLSREKTRKKATYKTAGSRGDLMKNSRFKATFNKARKRIKEMDIQFVEEPEPTRQALLEICAALRVDAKYNNFDNH